MAKAAQIGLEHFRWDRLVDETLDVLRDAVHQRPGTTHAAT